MFAIEKPYPRGTEDTTPFWEAAQRGELRLQRCETCGHVRFPPAVLCPRCWSEDSQWVPLSGRGHVFSWVIVHQSQHPAFNAETPYNVAIVELEEGPRLHTQIVECPLEHITIGMPVEVVFHRVRDDVVLPKFRPRSART